MLGFDTAYNSSEAIVFYGSYKSPYFPEVNSFKALLLPAVSLIF